MVEKTYDYEFRKVMQAIDALDRRVTTLDNGIRNIQRILLEMQESAPKPPVRPSGYEPPR